MSGPPDNMITTPHPLEPLVVAIIRHVGPVDEKTLGFAMCGSHGLPEETAAA